MAIAQHFFSRGRSGLIAVVGLLLVLTAPLTTPAHAMAESEEFTDGPVASATSIGTPRYHTEIERDAFDAINLQRTERGLSPLHLDVTSDGSLPVAEQQWRDCFMRLNTQGISHDANRSCQTDPTVDYQTEQILTIRWSERTSTPNAAVNPNTYDAVSAWESSPPHMEWLTAKDATAVRVYAGCVSTNSHTYLVIAATLLDEDGDWPSPNPNYRRSHIPTSSSPASEFNPNNYSSCDSSGGPTPIVGGASTPAHSLWRTAATRNPGLTNLSVEEPWMWSPFQIGRLYAAYFDRTPDESGWSYWMLQAAYNRVTNRTITLSEISQYFTQSDEFAQTYGSALSNEAFLTLVYRNVLDREPDAAGTAYWLGLMNRGLSKGDVMVWFSESAEYIQNTGPTLTGSCWNSQDRVTSYLCAATRVPTPAG